MTLVKMVIAIVFKGTLMNKRISWLKPITQKVLKPNAMAFISEPKATITTNSTIIKAKAVWAGWRGKFSFFNAMRRLYRIIKINSPVKRTNIALGIAIFIARVTLVVVLNNVSLSLVKRTTKTVAKQANMRAIVKIREVFWLRTFLKIKNKKYGNNPSRVYMRVIVGKNPKPLASKIK